MAAQLTNQSNDGSQSRDYAGVSYANAVLNLKNMDSNKENINAAPVSAATEQGAIEVQTKSKNSLQHKPGRQPSSYASASKPSGNSEEFPHISSSNSKSVNKRLPGKQDNKVKSNASQKSETSAPTDKQKPSPCNNESDVNSTEPVADIPEKKKLVEAPLPKINPWTVNKNAASVITGKTTSEQKQTTSPTASEKRVLQPHQQGTVGKYFAIYFNFELMYILKTLKNK